MCTLRGGVLSFEFPGKTLLTLASAGIFAAACAIPPPPTPKGAFEIATQNSFDYSSFIFVGITSMLAEGTDAHPAPSKGVAGFCRYYWRGVLDKTDGNYLVIFVLPAFLHEDERYYAKGEGNFFKRGVYDATRILITPDYHGNHTLKEWCFS